MKGMYLFVGSWGRWHMERRIWRWGSS